MGKRANGEGTVYERKDRPGSFKGEFTYRNPDTDIVDRKTFNGKTRKEAVAPFSTDAYFDAWFKGLSQQVNSMTEQ